jgi:DNA polymerase
MDIALDWHTAHALLQWQVEMGVTDAICDTPVNRYELPDAKPAAKPVSESDQQAAEAGAAGHGAAGHGAAHSASRPKTRVIPPLAPKPEALQAQAVAAAQTAAQSATSLTALHKAMTAYDLCTLKRGARSTVFADGQPNARVMVVGEAPDRDAERETRPFVGPVGQLLDRMLAAIDLSRHENVYITNVLPWRLPKNRDPRPEDIAMMAPFLLRHIELAQPDIVIAMGNIPCEALLNQRSALRARGKWHNIAGKQVIAMAHPDYLLQTPQAKRDAWADLLEVRARLNAND